MAAYISRSQPTAHSVWLAVTFDLYAPWAACFDTRVCFARAPNSAPRRFLVAMITYMVDPTL